MTENLLELIGYHSGRAVEEMERADAIRSGVGRHAHLELSRLHRATAGNLRNRLPVSAIPELTLAKELDMGEASREQGFRLFGCR